MSCIASSGLSLRAGSPAAEFISGEKPAMEFGFTGQPAPSTRTSAGTGRLQAASVQR